MGKATSSGIKSNCPHLRAVFCCFWSKNEQAQKALVHTRMLDGGDSDRITFAPVAPGAYEFICTYPGHLAAGMRGKLIVVP